MTPIVIACFVFIILEGARYYSQPFAFGLAVGMVIISLLYLCVLREPSPHTVTRQGEKP